ncbi:MAG: Wzz/FepE/Etk N-terminal domain-containing protein, partial [Armatimonadota bacterium]
MSDLPSKDILSDGQINRASVSNSYPPANDDIPPANQGEINLQELFVIFFRRRWTMFFVVAVVVLLGVLYTVTRRPVYETMAEIVVVTNSGGMTASSGDLGIISNLQAITRSRSIDTQAAILSSRSILRKAYDELPADMKSNGFNSDKIPAWAWNVTPKKNTDIIEITTKSYNPEAAAKLANNISKTYFLRDLEKNKRATRQARSYSEKQMIIISSDLDKANAELSSYKSQTGIVSP